MSLFQWESVSLTFPELVSKGVSPKGVSLCVCIKVVMPLRLFVLVKSRLQEFRNSGIQNLFYYGSLSKLSYTRQSRIALLYVCLLLETHTQPNRGRGVC